MLDILDIVESDDVPLVRLIGILFQVMAALAACLLVAPFKGGLLSAPFPGERP